MSGAAPRSPRQDRADGFGWCLAIGLPMVWIPPFIPSAFSFRGKDLTFGISGVDYMAFLKNYPIPQEVKGMADGDSLRQLFFLLRA